MIRMRGALALGLLAVLAAPATQAAVVISQVYGGAGCGTPGCSAYKNDYIEIFNNGAAAVSVNGWSVQYASATGTAAWTPTNLPNVTLQPGQYLLVAESSNANGTLALPAPDATGAIAMSATAGKVALVSSTTALTGGGASCPTTNVVDLVGFGSTANCTEGGAFAPAPSTANADIRAGGGCTDNNNNGSDFTAAAAAPRNTATTTLSCGGSTNPSVSGTATPNSVIPGGSTLLTATVTPGTGPTSSGVTVNADLTSIGGALVSAFHDDGLGGDVTAGDNVFSFSTTVTAGTSVGVKSLPVIVNDAQSRSGGGNIALTVVAAPNLSINDVSLSEGNAGTTTAHFVVTLSSAAPAGGVSFDIGTTDGTANGGTDYTSKTLVSQTIAQGGTVYGFDVDVSGDTKFEGDETYFVNVTNVTNANVVDGQGLGTITNDDALPTVSIADASQNEGNSGALPMSFAVSLSAPAPAGGVTVEYATNVGGGNPATPGTDYFSAGGTVTIPENGTSTSFNVGISGDTNVEGDETFLVDLSNPSNATLGDAQAVGTILNDDSVVPTFSIDNVSHNEGDSATTAFTFTVTSSVAAPLGGYTLNIATSDDTATAADNDYTAQNTTVTILQGATTAQFTVLANGDRKFEGDEAFKVTLSNPPATTVISPTAGVGTGTIQNDDVQPTISIANVSTTEGDSGTKTLDFTVHLATPALEGGVVFDIATADGTATTANNDYVAKSLSGQTIASGNSDSTFSVTINGDTTLELDEAFTVNVTATSGTNNPSASAIGTITNDDAKPTLSVANVSQAEGDSGTSLAAFTVSLSSASPVDVGFTINTANGTATAGTDYVAIVNGSGLITAGNLSTTVNVTINGDTTAEQAEAYALNLSAITNASNTTATATGTITNDDNNYTIMQLQGDGVATPIASTAVISTTGIVTARKPTGSGYFIQDPVGDGNPATSDGIFVFGSVTPVLVGDSVTIVSKVAEFSGSTELTTLSSVVVNSHGNPLPAPFVFDTHAPSSDPLNGYCMGSIGALGGPQAHNYACLDGMLVQVNDGVVTGATFGNANTNGANPGLPNGFYGTLAGVPQPVREVGLTYPGAGPTIPVFDGNPEVFEVYFPGLVFDGSAHIYNAGSHFSVTGPIQAFKPTGAVNPLYEIYPKTLTDGTLAPPNVQAVSDSPAGSLTIGTQNLLHFFNAAADGADTTQYTDACIPPATDATATDTCPTAAIYAKRLSKMAKQFCQLLKAPAVLNVQEVENASVLNDLKAAVFTECGVTYNAFTFQGNDPGGINTGMLVRNDVTVNSVTQLYKGTLTTAGCSGAVPYGVPPCLINDRPPSILDATLHGYHFAFLSIYDRSLSGLEANVYVGHKRVEEAVQISKIVQAWQSGATLTGAGNARLDGAGMPVAGTSFDLVGDASVPLVIAGDFNAYEFTDGYADVTGMIMGTAVQNQNTYWDDSATYVPPSPTLVDSGIKANPASRYSFNFSGFRQEIDHILMSRVAYKDFLSISNSHGNSDTSEAGPLSLDPTTPARSGDHDGQVITLASDRIFADDFENAP